VVEHADHGRIRQPRRGFAFTDSGGSEGACCVTDKEATVGGSSPTLAVDDVSTIVLRVAGLLCAARLPPRFGHLRRPLPRLEVARLATARVGAVVDAGQSDPRAPVDPVAARREGDLDRLATVLGRHDPRTDQGRRPKLSNGCELRHVVSLLVRSKPCTSFATPRGSPVVPPDRTATVAHVRLRRRLKPGRPTARFGWSPAAFASTRFANSASMGGAALLAPLAPAGGNRRASGALRGEACLAAVASS